MEDLVCFRRHGRLVPAIHVSLVRRMKDAVLGPHLMDLGIRCYFAMFNLDLCLGEIGLFFRR